MAHSSGHDEAYSERPLGGGHSEAITAHHHGHASHDGAAPFTDAEIQQLHAQDLYAARAVVTLMVSIFATGVVIYTIVAWVCAT